MFDSALFDRLIQVLGPSGYSVDGDRIAPLLREWRGRAVGETPFLALPKTTQEVAQCVRLVGQAGGAITVQGGNTGLVCGQIPQGEILLSTARLNQIRKIDAADDALIAEAGVILAQVQDAASEANRFFPLSLASQGSATIGGLVAANAGGVHVVRYGMMRDLVLGLEVVLADGTVLNGLKTLRKDNSGYDLKQLFIGSEGTLGIVTAAALKLFPKPGVECVAMAAINSPNDAIALLAHLKQATGALSAFELMNRLAVDLTVATQGARDPFASPTPYIALIEFQANGDIALEDIAAFALHEGMEKGWCVDVVVARTKAHAQHFWDLRERMPASHKDGSPQCNHDAAVPVSALPAFFETVERRANACCPGVRIVAFGHAGDGNIHYTIMAPPGQSGDAFPAAALNEIVHDTVIALGGSITAEHGVGVTRREDLARYKQPAQLALMAQLKAVMDPAGVLNPRLLFT
jgi:FAD/FMN-containing dehydrogenase